MTAQCDAPLPSEPEAARGQIASGERDSARIWPKESGNGSSLVSLFGDGLSRPQTQDLNAKCPQEHVQQVSHTLFPAFLERCGRPHGVPTSLSHGQEMLSLRHVSLSAVTRGSGAPAWEEAESRAGSELGADGAAWSRGTGCSAPGTYGNRRLCSWLEHPLAPGSHSAHSTCHYHIVIVPGSDGWSWRWE